MNFKDYLKINEAMATNILVLIDNGAIPISPKFFEDVFSQKQHYCFVSMKIDRVPSFIKMQGSKKQISSFTKFNTPRIFWGAEGWNWGDDEDSTIIAVVKGKITLQGNNDLWTDYDNQGRRWINILKLKEYGYIKSDKQIELILKISKNINKEFKKKYKDFLVDEANNKQKQQYIKDYIDISYEHLKKNQTKLIKTIDDEVMKDYMSSGYNEVLCYEYEIVEFIHLSYYEEDIDEKVFKNYKLKHVNDDMKVLKELKKYQKKNKKVEK
jgi:hypothetical protein